MSSRRRGGGRSSGAGKRDNFQVEQLGQNAGNLSLDDDGGWEEVGRKQKSRGGSSSARPWGPQPSGGRSRGLNGGTVKNFASSSVTTGRGNQQHYPAQNAVVQPPLQHGWNWNSRHGATSYKDLQVAGNTNAEEQNEDEDELDDNSDADAIDDSDDELLSDEFDSDCSQKSHETRKQTNWFKKFFETLDKLSVEQINSPEREWHCPACQGGPGAIDWYHGLQPLITHAKTKGSTRVKMHRELAKLLDEELRKRGTSAVPAGEMFGKWEGLLFEEKDKEIVWPPMVIVMNTRLEQDDNDKVHAQMK